MARSKEFLIKNYSELCELGVSAVKQDLLFWLRLRRARFSAVTLSDDDLLLNTCIP
jgi:hypothetical protein